MLVDALPDRGAPGTLHVFEADHETLLRGTGLDAHSMDPAAVFATLAALGGTPPDTVVVGCEVDDVDEGMGLSEPVAAAVPDAVRGDRRRRGRLLARRRHRRAEPCVSGIPGQVVGMLEGYGDQLALVDVAGEHRKVNIGMLPEETFAPATG